MRDLMDIGQLRAPVADAEDADGANVGAGAARNADDVGGGGRRRHADNNNHHRQPLLGGPDGDTGSPTVGLTTFNRSEEPLSSSSGAASVGILAGTSSAAAAAAEVSASSVTSGQVMETRID
uniref:Uncharacterized protein n=1 Tax=Macrostomum lignano TaxID=282301 RepID=A0A1I8IDA7_9PLAT